MLIPTTDAAVKDVARRKHELEEHFLVDCPTWEVAERFIDKRHTYELAEAVGVPVPRTLVPTGTDDVEAYAAGFRYPCIVKPRESHLWAARLGGKLTVVGSRKETARRLRHGGRRRPRGDDPGAHPGSRTITASTTTRTAARTASSPSARRASSVRAHAGPGFRASC